MDRVNQDLKASEYIETTARSTFQITNYVTYDTLLRFGGSPVVHQIHQSFPLPNIRTIQHKITTAH